jgi:hypothetical protein
LAVFGPSRAEAGAEQIVYLSAILDNQSGCGQARTSPGRDHLYAKTGGGGRPVGIV